MTVERTVTIHCEGRFQGRRCWEYMDTHEEDITKARECAYVFGWRRLLVDDRDNYIDLCLRIDHDEETSDEPSSGEDQH